MKLSLIVPLFNEEATVGVLLESIAAQSLVPAEIVLVDAGSTDNTSALVAADEATHQFASCRAVVCTQEKRAIKVCAVQATIILPSPMAVFAGPRLAPLAG